MSNLRQKSAWRAPNWALPIMLTVAIVWVVLECLYGSYLFAGIGIVLTLMVVIEARKRIVVVRSSESSDEKDSQNPSEDL